MIYCQMKSRAKLDVRQNLTLDSVADLLGPDKARKASLSCPKQEGVWKIDALAAARALNKACPGEDVTMLGPDTCYVHRVHSDRRDRTKWLRTAFAFAILMMGSALGLAWFHSDVDMPKAQEMVYQAITGEKVKDERLITIPYVVGVTLGVAVFYALPGRNAVTPLEVKLTEYQEDMEKTEGKEPRPDA